MIICDTCKSEHPVVFEKTNQGHGCSASAYIKDGKTYIQGWYGSVVADGHIYEVSPGHVIELGSICDECITRLKDDDKLTLIDVDYFYNYAGS